jgi:hypothetical protein
MKQLTVQFSESAEEEVSSLIQEMHMVPVIAAIQDGKAPIPDELRESVTQMVGGLLELFSATLPENEPDLNRALRTSSRDINLAHLLREKGLFRLYRLLHNREKDGVLSYRKVANPDTGSPFSTQEEFIGYFCRESHVPRALVFTRMATISRLTTLGKRLEEIFDMLAKKPFIVYQALNEVVEWEKDQIKSLDPTIATMVAKKVAPEHADQIEELAALAEDDPDAMQELKDAFKPVLSILIDEVAGHQSNRDALDYVVHDVLGKPEIRYKWEPDGDYLVIEMVRKQIDEQGNEYMAGIISIPLIPDTPALPAEIRRDLIKRLPISNRSSLA